GGQRCVFDLRPGLKDAAGALVGGPRQFSFTTGGPTIRAVAPGADDGLVAEDQVFLLALNAVPTPTSVAAHAACLIDGVGEAVPIDLMPDATRDTILKAAAGNWQVRDLLVKAGWRKADYGDDPLPPRSIITAAKCRRVLPAGGRLTISWGGNVATANGLPAGQPKRLDFKVRAAFTAKLECARVNAAAACSPLETMRVSFSGDVPTAAALAVRLKTPDGRSLAPTTPTSRSNTLTAVSFKPPFTERGDYRIEIPAALTDDAGRPVANAARFPLAIRTGDFPPLAKFAGTFGILEAVEGGLLPVTLRSVESPVVAKALAGRDLAITSDADIAHWLQRLDSAEDRTSIETPIPGTDETRSTETTRNTPLITATTAARAFTISRDKNPRAFEVVGIPLAKRGFHIVELASPALGAALLGPGQTRYVATGALVTDMAVHFLWGRGTSLAWVTTLSDAAPVAGAAITVTDTCTGKLLWQGRTTASGRALIGDSLPPPASYGSCKYGTDHPLIVSARTAEDHSFTLSSWGNGIQGSDFGIAQGWGHDRRQVHAVFDRTLLRAGETINMKLIARTRTDAGFTKAPLAPTTLILRHLGSDATFTTPMAANGAATWTAPASAPLGDYAVELTGAPGAVNSAPGEPVTAGGFAIEDYRLPTIRARVTGPPGKQVAPSSVPLDLTLTYLAGGGVAHAPVKLRTTVSPRSVTVPGYDDWTFSADVIKAGIAPLDGDGEDGTPSPLR
ncbi:MAG: alpha-2-macroglobulin, partial [Sandarakinorhabdus sp.]|nr:alpha-2-macroglobulin [Sandarakinorhabdus sp.]